MNIKTVSISEDVEGVLRQAKLEGNNLTLQGTLDRSMYSKVNKILELIGFKWNKKAGCHVGQGDSADKLLEGLGGGKVVNEKQTYQFFETPADVAARMVSLAEIVPGHRVLEPSAGKGAIIKVVERDCPGLACIDACELNPQMASDLAIRAEANRKASPIEVNVSCGDFLQVNQKYDRIVMNPPFTQGQDIEHVRHAYKLLLPGGRLVAITSVSWMGGTAKKVKAFREWYEELQEQGFANPPDELDSGTFKPSGTGVPTLMIMMLKPKDKDHPINKGKA